MERCVGEGEGRQECVKRGGGGGGREGEAKGKKKLKESQIIMQARGEEGKTREEATIMLVVVRMIFIYRVVVVGEGANEIK